MKYITLFEVVASVLGKPDATSLSGEDFALARRPMGGGCERCGATLGGFNAYPTRTGNIACGGCLDDGMPGDGFETVAEFLAWERARQLQAFEEAQELLRGTCPDCNGSGTATCSECDGTGGNEVWGVVEHCGTCHDRGDEDCRRCLTTGRDLPALRFTTSEQEDPKEPVTLDALCAVNEWQWGRDKEVAALLHLEVGASVDLGLGGAFGAYMVTREADDYTPVKLAVEPPPPPRLFKCASPVCPGLTWKASDSRHPCPPGVEQGELDLDAPGPKTLRAPAYAVGPFDVGPELVVFEPFIVYGDDDAPLAGFKATNPATGRVQYVYLTPSTGGHSADVFVYQGPTSDPTDERGEALSFVNVLRDDVPDPEPEPEVQTWTREEIASVLPSRHAAQILGKKGGE